MSKQILSILCNLLWQDELTIVILDKPTVGLAEEMFLLLMEEEGAA